MISCGAIVGASVVTLDGSASTLDSCVNGFIEYRFASLGQVVQDWSNDFIFRDNPVFSTAYQMDVRCSVDPECTDEAIVQVNMAGNLREVAQGGDDGRLLLSQPVARIAEGAAGNGLADTEVAAESDDLQVVPLGGVVAPDGTVIDAGPDGVLQTLPAGDDVVDNQDAVLDWMATEAGLGYDIQQVDISLTDPVHLRADPLATPPSTLPESRLCRLAQLGDGVVTYLDDVVVLQPGEFVGYLVNSRRISDAVPGSLGAGQASGDVRRARPEPPTTSCP